MKFFFDMIFGFLTGWRQRSRRLMSFSSASSGVSRNLCLLKTVHLAWSTMNTTWKKFNKLSLSAFTIISKPAFRDKSEYVDKGRSLPSIWCSLVTSMQLCVFLVEPHSLSSTSLLFLWKTCSALYFVNFKVNLCLYRCFASLSTNSVPFRLIFGESYLLFFSKSCWECSFDICQYPKTRVFKHEV